MTWKKIRRSSGLIEHVCSCGVGHPNHASALWLAQNEAESEKQVEDRFNNWLIHGCCGCCSHDDFPGTIKEGLKHAHKLLMKRTKNK